MQQSSKNINSDSLKKTFLNELLNSELIDSENSKINPKQYIYTPLVEPIVIKNTTTSFITEYINNDNNNPSQDRASIASNLSDFESIFT